MLELENVTDDDVRAVRSRLGFARNIIVKVGSNVLVGGGAGVINRRVFCALVEQLADLATVADRRVTLVTSGAVALGRRTVHQRRSADASPVRRSQDAAAVRAETLAEKQALAALGQPALMNLYSQEFAFYGVGVAQVLLSREDFGERERFLNARTTFRELSELPSIVPIVNENDTVSTEEIRFGDNDALAAMLTSAVGADLLIVLSDVQGLFTADPARHAEARRVPVAYTDDAGLTELAGPSQNDGMGTGGMVSKVRAARMAGAWGVPTVVAPGREAEVLRRVMRGDDLGTLFVPRNARLPARKAWIRFVSRTTGVISVDDGAAGALRAQGRSLLPRGITGVTGDFRAGAAVAIQSETGREIARGIVNYGAADLKRIAGRRSEEIAGILGYQNGDEAVHRDDLVLIEELEGVERG